MEDVTCIIANITWNSNDWKSPSDDKSNHSFVKGGGLPHESWNFDFDNKRNTNGKIYGFAQFTNQPKDCETKTYLVIFRSDNQIVGFYGNARITDYVLFPKNQTFNVKKEYYNIVGDKALSVLLKNKIDDSSKRFLFGAKRISQGGFNYIENEDALQILTEAARLNKDENTIIKIINWLQNNTMDMDATKMDNYVSLLKSNHNLILTGAPGTGKTYLAKQIAQAMGCTDNEIGFVQFHPSYDYTDFVEGLRPLDDGNGNVGFERKDGVFKEFCAKALENLTDSQKSLQTLQQETSVRDLIDDFVQDAIDSDLKLETQGTKNVFHIIENKAKHITIDIPKNEKTRVIALPKSDLITLLENKVDISGSKDIQLYFQRKYRTQQDSYTYVLYEKLKSLESKTKVETVSLIPKKNFVFIIDEINRGEINKIFGELFFSIDPGYRGEKGRVQTQYQNMVEDCDAFKKGFFVPENVYIIGTMNDIDRSVESMDFAFRRRFAFKEVTADDSKAMLDDFEWKDDAVKRMDSLNAAIEKTEGLTSAYHIGASYFLKLKNYNGDFGQLWDCHLKGLLFEYLRGTQSVGENMRKLEKAYNLNNTAADDSDTDN